MKPFLKTFHLEPVTFRLSTRNCDSTVLFGGLPLLKAMHGFHCGCHETPLRVKIQKMQKYSARVSYSIECFCHVASCCLLCGWSHSGKVKKKCSEELCWTGGLQVTKCCDSFPIGRQWKWIQLLFLTAESSSHIIWSNYSDLTRPHPKWWFSKGSPLISGKSRLVKYYNLTRYYAWTQQLFKKILMAQALHILVASRWISPMMGMLLDFFYIEKSSFEERVTSCNIPLLKRHLPSPPWLFGKNDSRCAVVCLWEGCRIPCDPLRSSSLKCATLSHVQTAQSAKGWRIFEDKQITGCREKAWCI